MHTEIIICFWPNVYKTLMSLFSEKDACVNQRCELICSGQLVFPSTFRDTRRLLTATRCQVVVPMWAKSELKKAMPHENNFTMTSR